MRTRYLVDLNPAYPQKGERRYAVYKADSGSVTKLSRQFMSRRPAEQHACQLQVSHDLERLLSTQRNPTHD